MSELDFLSGKFFDVELPKPLRYLNKYFKTDLEKQFLRYHYVFGNCDNFIDHTGYYCTKRWLIRLEKRYSIITEMHRKAKAEFDLEMVTLLESGKFKAGQIK